MESKLKAVRRGHRGQVTKLFKKFDEIENNSDLDKDDVKLISDAIEQKQKTIVDLNEKILDLTSEEDVEEEIQESDEYMFNLESKLRKIRKITHSDSISQNVASTSLDPNANSFIPSYPTNSSLTNANVIRSNETEINVQPTNFDNFRSMQNTHRDLQSTNNLDIVGTEVRPLPLEIQTTWKNLAKDLEKTTYTELKRPYFPNLPNQKTQLHVFVDASTTAYGASVYICNHHESSLVIAKNRVAPLKQLTLPQLELMAALIGARLADHVKSVLHIEDITFWSDSQIVLQWLSTSKQLKRFIRNRVTEIRKLTNTQEWRYCPTKDNPADLLTRGLSVSQFEKNTLWFNGPEWITDASKWPSWKPNDTTVLLTSTDIEESSTADNAIDNQQGIHQIVQITRYSTLSKLLRITAYLLRFIRNCRSPILQRNKAKYVSREELQDATECWILNCQRTSFKDEMLYLKLKDTKPTVLVRQLRLYLNNKDAICCGGRIHNAPVCENTKFPYLLPRSHPFTKLVVLDIHKYMKHSGVLSTVHVPSPTSMGDMEIQELQETTSTECRNLPLSV
ncbi:unnamed protein product [Mytilus edulis]|uniref:Uncharacterized protein n=1 Tax=Mytilus edulis TaxID=6550 RepID=A0A8S3S3Y5_MYTED|nr:unnamed protein product [Mytilus edulis]